MGRQTKIGLDYFQIDTAPGDKVKYLRKKLGMAGYGIFVLILERIYRDKGYYCIWDERAQTLFCEYGIEIKYLKQVVDCCLMEGLFNNDMFLNHKVLTSAEIQRRYMEIIRICKRRGIELISEFDLISSEEIPKNSETIRGNPEQMQQRKEKEKKENKIKKYVWEFSEILKKAFDEFVEMRKKIRKPPTEYAIELLEKKLLKISGGNFKIMLLIIEQSIVKSWQDFYPVKKEFDSKVYPGIFNKSVLSLEEIDFNKKYSEQMIEAQEKKNPPGNINSLIKIKLEQIDPKNK